jgi:hypothetical protein
MHLGLTIRDLTVIQFASTTDSALHFYLLRYIRNALVLTFPKR